MNSRALLLGGLLTAAVVGCTAVASGEPVSSPSASPGMAASVPNAVEIVGPTGPTEVGRVVDITDGDTVRVVIDGAEHRLRYIGIDTPETVAPGQPVEAYGPAATTANALLVGGEDVVLEMDISNTDRYDRLLRYVWLAPGSGDAPTDAWTLVNLELVELGVAEAIEYPPDVKYAEVFEAAEAEAQAAGRGMWAQV